MHNLKVSESNNCNIRELAPLDTDPELQTLALQVTHEHEKAPMLEEGAGLQTIIRTTANKDPQLHSCPRLCNIDP